MKRLKEAMVSLLFAVAIAAVFMLFDLAIAANVIAAELVRGRGLMGPEERHHDWGGNKPGPWDHLNLTDDQKAKIRALREAHFRDIKPLQDQMFSKRGDLKLLWLQQNPDKEKILAVQKEIRAIRDQIQEKATALRVDVFNVLTPEQQDKVREVRSKPRMPPPGMPGGKKGPGPGMMGPGPGMMPR